MPSSQEEAADDDEGVMPEEIEGHSPIDDLKGFDWDKVDDELADFMGSDTESDSESDSDGARGTKRPSDEITDGDESDESTSRLAKKQKSAKSRTTGLKTVKTPQSEDSLPTPGVTGDEGGAAGTIEDDSSFGDDLEREMEAEMEAELAREVEEARSGG